MTVIMDLNQHIINMEYAVRGPLVILANQLKKEGKDIVMANIGNPLAFVDNKPISYLDDMMAMVNSDNAWNDVLNGKSSFSEPNFADLVSRVANLREINPVGTRAYSHEKGHEFLRDMVVDFINKRDGFSGRLSANPEHIYMTNGASEAIEAVMSILITNPNDGGMVPIPQYPIYSALLGKLNAQQVNYFPDESTGWGVTRNELERSYDSAKKKGINVKFITTIDPNNPTAAMLPFEDKNIIVEFAEDKKISIMADEVYQNNAQTPFISYAKVLGNKDVPLFSFHSASKGYFGLCGKRGGYVEVRNAPQDEKSGLSMLDILQKLRGSELCSNIEGQYAMALSLHPPEEGDASYAAFASQRDSTLSDIRIKTEMFLAAQAKMKGVTGAKNADECNALYMWPNLGNLPSKSNKHPSVDYCHQLLLETGICAVPGAGFGATDGNYLRFAVLPPVKQLEQVLSKMVKFHNNYVK